MKSIKNRVINIYVVIQVIAFILSVNTVLCGNLELGTRYLKLGNTYREAKNYDKAIEYLKKGENLINRVETFDGLYWSAVAQEYYGYLFRDMGHFDEAMNHYRNANAIYNNIITQIDGSPKASDELMLSLSIQANAELEKILNESKNKNPKAVAGLSENNNSKNFNFDKLKLKVLPSGIPDDIKSISLSNNKFKDFPTELYRFKELEYLNMSENKLTEIPNGIKYLENLHYLDLSHNKIKKISNDIAGLKELKELNLESNGLKSIPTGLSELKNLKILNLRKNKIPHPMIAQLIKSLPNTNILFDEYILKPEEEEDVNY